MPAKKRLGRPPTGNRHQAGKMVRLADDLHAVVQAAADAEYRTLTAEVRRLLVKALSAEGLWPPAKGKAGAS
jgi:hypothetical protein